ncbi:NUDIX domain-containing protein [Streptacidiphilus sp. MAP5-52]|uniref:NUDIX domain-containing protein n=1 Tax=Streptacidiphilus sp. MAP5-52 TaxID=3156267 RepID=UPI0035168CDA
MHQNASNDDESCERARFAAAANILITRPDGTVLLVHHRRSGLWVLPGGKTQTDESPRTCALREGTEELGVPIQMGPLLSVHWLTAKSALWPAAADIPHAYPCHLTTFAAAISTEDAERITVPDDELLGYAWWDPVDVARPHLMETANAAHLLAVTGAGPEAVTYLEDGSSL